MMIPSRAELIERLKDIRVVEINARDSYKDDLHSFRNARILSVLNRIEQDEEYHIKILDDLIRMLE